MIKPVLETAKEKGGEGEGRERRPGIRGKKGEEKKKRGNHPSASFFARRNEEERKKKRKKRRGKTRFRSCRVQHLYDGVISSAGGREEEGNRLAPPFF